MKSQELGAVELLLLAGLALLWALWTVARLLVVPALALLLSWCCRASSAGTAPSVTAAPEPQAPEPIEAPQPAASPVTDAPPVPALTAAAVPILAELASEAAAALQPLTVKQLRAQARAAGLPRALSRSGRREALVMALAGCSVALI